jgi:hypothetical protein
MTPESLPHVDLVSQVVSAVPVIVGGAVGIIGGLASTRYGGKLIAEREFRRDRREKLERLVLAAYELDVWLKREENFILFRGTENLETCPLAVVETGASLFFPELDKEAQTLSATVKAYRKWLMDGRTQMNMQNSNVVPQAHIATMGSVYNPFLSARDALISKAKTSMAQLGAA